MVMTGYNHVAVGVLVAVIIKNPVVVVPVAFASHFVLDALPHFKYPEHNSNKFLYLLAIDGALCSAIYIFALYKWPHQWLAITLGAFFAALPDFMWLFYYKKPLPKNWFYKFSAWIQWGERPWGMLIEIPVFALLVFTIIAKH
jgi:hypothetical protein